MFQTELMSTAMATELLQSVGIELSVFAITIALAMTWQGVPFGKKSCCAQKWADSPRPTLKVTSPVQVKGPGMDQAGFSGSHRQVKEIPACPKTPTQELPNKIHSIITCAGRRQDADAIAIYMGVKAKIDLTAIGEALKKGQKHPADMFNLMVQCAGRLGRPELIEVFLDDMQLGGIERSLGLYESSMKILASKKCYKAAISVCSRLVEDGFVPSPVTLSCAINFAVETGEADKAIAFFDQLAATANPSIRAYMTILRVHSKRRDWPKSLAMLRDMQKRQVAIDSIVLNVVLATGVAAGHLDQAKAVLQEFSQVRIADVVSHNTIMKGFAQQKELDKATSLLDEMCSMNVKPNTITFNTAMDAAVRSSRVADAWRLFARMRDAGLSPDKFTCTTLMKGLQNGATSEQLGVILDILRSMTSECDSKLCGILFCNVLEAAAELKEPALTAKAVAQMREQRVMLSSQDYQRLLQILI